ncbi:MAG: putative periplasmic ligand-binding sensor domain protein [Bacteroidetes bacterium]|nr:putative periplasmic ligand-binding sensor domain protein [Bacteroidota bacterium]
MRHKLVVFFLLTRIFFIDCLAQPSQSAVIDRINTKELNNSFVSALFEDQKGYLWVGTLAGLNRYNGYDFTRFKSIGKDSSTLSNAAISCIAQLDQDKIIIGTRAGLNVYNYLTNKFSRVKLDTGILNYKKKQNIYSIVLNPVGGKLVGTGDGILMYDAVKNTLESVLTGNETFLSGWTIQSVCFDRIGNLWAGGKKLENGKLISRVFKCNLQAKTFKEIKVYEGGSSGHVGISEDYLGNIWVAVDDGLVNINPSTLAQNYYKAPEKFYSNISYTHTKDNTIWQCYWSFGLTAFDIDKKEFKIYQNDPDNEKSLMSNKCWALHKDENDILWIGSDIGLQKLTNSRPSMEIIKRKYQNPNNSFLANRISAVVPSQNHNNLCFVGVDGEGFSVYDRLNKTSVNFGPGATNKNEERFVNQFLEDINGDVYVAGQYHFHKIAFTNNIPWVKSYFNLQEHYTANIIQDPHNKNMLWMGGIGEIFSFNKQNQQFEFIKEPNGFTGLFAASFNYKDLLYFTHTNGLTVFNPVNHEIKSLKIPDVGSLTNALVINDSTVLLASQYLGLIKYYPNSNKHEIIFRQTDQLFPEINGMVYYRNFVWMATGHGLIRWNPLTNEYSEITADDGLPSETVHQLNVLEGYFYIATQNGLVIFNPDFQVSHFNIPKIEVTSLKGSGNSFVQENIINGGEIILEENQNSFQVNFTLFDFNMPEKNSYKFKMTPLDKEWKNVGNRHSVYFNDLLPGTYVFELMGANADNTWCAEPFRVTIKIVPPFYKSNWFYYFSVSLAIFMAIAFVIIRFISNERKQKRLEEIISQRTAEIQEKRAELMDSISYAERIQKAIFVGEDILPDHIPESFILYKPKDKVSGDFYWIGKYKDLLIVFAGDCTGHGVPGAMLSIVGTSLLNKIVYEENTYLPGEILTRLKYLFYNQLSLKETNIRDGMDASVLTINMINKTAYFSAAKNDCCYIVNNELFELKAQRNSIGESGNIHFSSQTIPYAEGRNFYLFSDGLKEQFGGPKQKKLSSKRFKQILLKASLLPVHEQQKFILDLINSWKAGLPQTDDIMVIGLTF